MLHCRKPMRRFAAWRPTISKATSMRLGKACSRAYAWRLRAPWERRNARWMAWPRFWPCTRARSASLETGRCAFCRLARRRAARSGASLAWRAHVAGTSQRATGLVGTIRGCHDHASAGSARRRRPCGDARAWLSAIDERGCLQQGQLRRNNRRIASKSNPAAHTSAEIVELLLQKRADVASSSRKGRSGTHASPLAPGATGLILPVHHRLAKRKRLRFERTFLGHTDPASTAVYLTITEELLREADRRFRVFAPGGRPMMSTVGQVLLSFFEDHLKV